MSATNKLEQKSGRKKRLHIVPLASGRLQEREEKLNQKLFILYHKNDSFFREKFKLNFQYKKISSLEGFAVGNSIAGVYLSNYFAQEMTS